MRPPRCRSVEAQALRGQQHHLRTLEQAEPREGDESARDELTRRAGPYVQPTSTPGSPAPWPRGQRHQRPSNRRSPTRRDSQTSTSKSTSTTGRAHAAMSIPL